nr:polyadenylate-binding protein-interacting protein 12-like isoform X1 [Tanacetum cinerariifolium]
MAVVENIVNSNEVEVVESNEIVVDQSNSIANNGSGENDSDNKMMVISSNGNGVNGHHENNGVNGNGGFKKEMRDLEEMLSKLNPMAEEFVPGGNNGYMMRGGMVQVQLPPGGGAHFGYAAVHDFLRQANNVGFVSGNGVGFVNGNGVNNGRKKGNFGNGKRRMNSRTNMAQREDAIKRTVHVSDIDQQVTEEQLAALFINCGQVVDCRVCGDPNSVLRFAFIEFTDEEGARNALSLAGTMLGYYPVRVLPSKTAIAPVNPTFLPRVTQADVKLFFESLCGEVYRLRLLGDYHHSSRIAFVEFVMAESAIAALNCSGAVLGSLPIRVSPSKTPVRPRTTRPPMH